jgi:hypothetical protein
MNPLLKTCAAALLALASTLALAGTVTVNGDDCGTQTGSVQIAPNGDVTINTDDDLCGLNRGSGGGGGGDPDPVTQHTLTVNSPSNGTIVDATSGVSINCGSTCSDDIDEGTTVTLVANPDSGYDFDGWSGGGCSGTGNCQVTMNGDVSGISASFSPQVVSGDCPSAPSSIRSYPTTAGVVSLSGTEIAIYRLPAGSSGVNRTAITASSNGSRMVTITECPGDIDYFDIDSACRDEGFETTNLGWNSSGANGRCDTNGATRYLNIAFRSVTNQRGVQRIGNSCSNSTCTFLLDP